MSFELNIAFIVSNTYFYVSISFGNDISSSIYASYSSDLIPKSLLKSSSDINAYLFILNLYVFFALLCSLTISKFFLNISNIFSKLSPEISISNLFAYILNNDFSDHFLGFLFGFLKENN